MVLLEPLKIGFSREELCKVSEENNISTIIITETSLTRGCTQCALLTPSSKSVTLSWS